MSRSFQHWSAPLPNLSPLVPPVERENVRQCFGKLYGFKHKKETGFSSGLCAGQSFGLLLNAVESMWASGLNRVYVVGLSRGDIIPCFQVI